MSVCIQRFLVWFTGCTALQMVSFKLSSFSGSVSPTLSSLMYRNVPLLPSFGEAGGDEDSRRQVKAEWLIWGGKCSRRSCSTSGMGVTVTSLKAVMGLWGWASIGGEQGAGAGLEVSGSEQLSSDEKWLQCDSATEGRLPLRDGESNSEELVLRCSRSWVSISACISLTFASPLLMLLAFFQRLPLLVLTPEVEASFDHGGQGQEWLACWAQRQVEGHEHVAPFRPAELLLQLASSRLLLALPCLTFSCLDSTSACTSRLLSLQNQITYI